jgi:hypothetical protein
MEAQDLTFATALNCMDGRVQLPVNEAVRSIFGVLHVDTITEAGIVRLLSDETDSPETMAALSSIRISLDKHGSRGIAVAAHHDCAGNPCSDAAQQAQLRRAVAFLRERFATCKIIGLWIGDDWVPRVIALDSSEGPDRV